MDLLFAPETYPFAVAGLILVGLVLVEILTVLIGVSASEMVEKSIGFHHAGHTGNDENTTANAFYWLNPGRVPFLVLIMLMLAAFSAAGFFFDALAMTLWKPMPVLPGVVLAVVAAVPLVRGGSRIVSAIIPRDETYVVDHDVFIGRVGTVTIGPLDEGSPGKVRVQDPHGNWHFLMARAAEGQPPLAVGSPALLVERDGQVYRAIAPDDTILTGTAGN